MKKIILLLFFIICLFIVFRLLSIGKIIQKDPKKLPHTQLYAVISGATGGTGQVLIKQLKKQNIKPIIIRRRQSIIKSDDINIVADYDDLTDFPENFENLLIENDIQHNQIIQYHSLHGCGQFDTYTRVSADFIYSYMNANCKSHMVLINFFLTHQFNNLSRITTVSSVCGHFPPELFEMYGGCKIFLENATITMACQKQNSAIDFVVARPAGIRRTQFLQQKEMQKSGIVGKLTNLPIITVNPEAVCNVLLRKHSGVYSVGWINYCEDLGEIFPSLYNLIVKMMKMKADYSNESQ